MNSTTSRQRMGFACCSVVGVLQGVVSSRERWQLVFLHDQTGRVVELYDPSGFPAAYVIDRLGRIRHVHYGVGTVDVPSIEAQALALALR